MSLSRYWPISPQTIWGALLLTSGMVFVAVVTLWLNGFTRPIAGSIVLFSILIVLSAIDLQVRLLPDWLTLPLIVIGVVNTWASGANIWSSIAGAGAGYLIVFGLANYWLHVRRKQGIGLGDAKLLAAAGAWVGVLALPLVLLAASSVALVAVCAYGVTARTNRIGEMAIPFGPFLSFGTWIVWCGMPMLLK